MTDKRAQQVWRDDADKPNGARKGNRCARGETSPGDGQGAGDGEVCAQTGGRFLAKGKGPETGSG